MADTASTAKPDEHAPTLDPALARKVRRVAWIAAAALVAGTAWFVFRAVNDTKSAERWEALDRVERRYFDDSTRSWLLPTTSPVDARSRDEHVRELEEFLAKSEDDDALAAHLHARIAELLLTQVFGLTAGGSREPLAPRMDAAKRHLETLRDRYPDAQVNWSAFARGRAGSVVRLALDTLEQNRRWYDKYGLKAVEPDADNVVVLRTTEGDLVLRLYATASPAAAKAFLDLVCSGGLDGVRIFERRDDTDESWVRVGDARTKKADPTEQDRIAWADASPGESRNADVGRYRVLHTKGVVTSWHAPGEPNDDAQQFLFVTKDSPGLDFVHTPFARVVDGPSMATLERIAARDTQVKATPDLRTDPKRSALADQLVTPVLIKKALAYEKGALRACHDASKVDADEKSLDGLVADRLRETPPAPPAAPPAGGDAAMK